MRRKPFGLLSSTLRVLRDELTPLLSIMGCRGEIEREQATQNRLPMDAPKVVDGLLGSGRPREIEGCEGAPVQLRTFRNCGSEGRASPCSQASSRSTGILSRSAATPAENLAVSRAQTSSSGLARASMRLAITPSAYPGCHRGRLLGRVLRHDRQHRCRGRVAGERPAPAQQERTFQQPQRGAMEILLAVHARRSSTRSDTI